MKNEFDVIEKIETAVMKYNNGDFGENVFDMARNFADSIIEEQADFIHFVVGGKKWEIIHSQTTTCPNHKMFFHAYKTEKYI